MKPFLKWAGNKYQIINNIKAVLPHGKRLVEPFVGSGSVFLNTNYEHYLLFDSNGDLINLFNSLKEEGEEFIKYCQSFFKKDNNQAVAYYDFREQFNHVTDMRLKSALFIYLNRHCFNGLCRYNAKGKFNVPFGSYQQPYFPYKEMQFFYHKSTQAKFMQDDFTEAFSQAEKGDVIYSDPPYVPLSSTANFTSYSKVSFDQKQQVVLAEHAMQAAAKGIPVIISNHDTEFVQYLYRHARLITFPVQRYISSKSEHRNKVMEVLAVFDGAI